VRSGNTTALASLVAVSWLSSACGGNISLGSTGASGGASSGNSGGLDASSSGSGIDASLIGTGGTFVSSGSSSEAGDEPPPGGFTVAPAEASVGGEPPPPFTVTPAPAGLAGVAFVINGVVQTPRTCPSDNWEFPPTAAEQEQEIESFEGGPPPTQGQFSCGFSFPPPRCAGATSVLLVNTGQVPAAYIAQTAWSGVGFVPGVATGDPDQLDGVLDPGGQVDITSVYEAGIVAVIGSAEPFSYPDAGKYLSDEGTIPWPAGVSGSGGATQMFVAEIEIVNSCHIADVVW
jgi:hypothetical protein